jgi:hypothetical protein
MSDTIDHPTSHPAAADTVLFSTASFSRWLSAIIQIAGKESK